MIQLEFFDVFLIVILRQATYPCFFVCWRLLLRYRDFYFLICAKTWILTQGISRFKHLNATHYSSLFFRHFRNLIIALFSLLLLYANLINFELRIKRFRINLWSPFYKLTSKTGLLNRFCRSKFFRVIEWKEFLKLWSWEIGQSYAGKKIKFYFGSHLHNLRFQKFTLFSFFICSFRKFAFEREIIQIFTKRDYFFFCKLKLNFYAFVDLFAISLCWFTNRIWNLLTAVVSYYLIV